MEDKILKPMGYKGRCPSCEIDTKWHWNTCAIKDNISPSLGKLSKESVLNNISSYCYSYCTNCQTLILGNKNDKSCEILYPAQKLLVGEETSGLRHNQTIWNIFLAASESVRHSTGVPLALARMALEYFVTEMIQKHKKNKIEKLQKKIDFLHNEKLLSEEDAKIAHEIRKIGNNAIHSSNPIDFDISDVKKVWHNINRLIIIGAESRDR